MIEALAGSVTSEAARLDVSLLTASRGARFIAGSGTCKKKDQNLPTVVLLYPTQTKSKPLGGLARGNEEGASWPIFHRLFDLGLGNLRVASLDDKHRIIAAILELLAAHKRTKPRVTEILVGHNIILS